MCVIAVVEDADGKPTEAQVKQMWARNDHGGGVAWWDGKDLHFHKDLDEAQMIHYAKTLPVPFVLHFRIASVGGRHADLTHPFLVHPDAPQLRKAKSKVPVLFHNGTWGRWKDECYKLAIARGVKVPDGKWSDSRALAWIGGHIGIGIYEFVDEKIALFMPDGKIECFGNWELVDGFWVSNKIWVPFVQVQDSRRFQGYCQPVVAAITDTSSTTKGTGSASAEAPFLAHSLAYYEDLRMKGTLSHKGFKRIKHAFLLVANEQTRLEEKLATAH